MEKSKQELEAEVIVLTERAERFKRLSQYYFKVLEYYANPNCKWDYGRTARNGIKKASRKTYKPLKSAIAEIFKDRPPRCLSEEEVMEWYSGAYGDDFGGDADW